MADTFTWSLGAPYVALAFAIGYLFGSIPFGVILTRVAGLGDIRKVGSGNIGATNVLRTGHKGLAAATLLGDALKGTAAVLLTGWLWGQEAAIVGALGALVGHCFPVWLKFRGGKGVATFIGCLVGLSPAAAGVFALIWLGLAFATRYSSLAALVAAAATPFVLWSIGPPKMALAFALLVPLICWKHRENIARLLAGTEGRIGQKG